MVKAAETDVGMNVINQKKIKKEQEQELLESFRFIDQLATIVKQQPNKVWSRKQAKLFKFVYYSINENWRRSGRITF